MLPLLSLILSAHHRLSIEQLLMFCKSPEEIPYEGHKYLTGHCYYGGRITDTNDRRLLLTLLDHLYRGDSFGQGIESSVYRIPDWPNRTNTLAYIGQLPTTETPPEVYGLHANASHFRKSTAETNNLLSGTMQSQTEFLERFRQQAEAQANRAGLLSACESILAKVPEPANVKVILDNFPLSGSALNTVLFNETRRLNEICKFIVHSLMELIRMLKGDVNATEDLERLQDSLAKQTVPEKWSAKSFRTRKNLGGFLQELVDRMKFFKAWLEDGEPTTMWISGFLCPQALFAALRWNCAKHTKRPVDEVVLRITPTQFEGHERLTSMEFSDFCRVSGRRVI